MKSRIGILVSIVVIASAVGLFGATGASSNAGQSMPFLGAYSGEAAFTSPVTVEFDGRGWASKLGISTNDGMSVLQAPVETTECQAGWGIPDLRTETITSANGDTLVIQMEGIACPVAANAFAGIGDWQVIGGTGRFADAEGRGRVSAEADFEAGTFECLLIGWIDY